MQDNFSRALKLVLVDEGGLDEMGNLKGRSEE